ncbi:hypothetical protein J6590_092412 [Homalodisca vitripennis]|nr:hypothetical protein J6590_092412 [Homalodisca vitripennis]
MSGVRVYSGEVGEVRHVTGEVRFQRKSALTVIVRVCVNKRSPEPVTTLVVWRRLSYNHAVGIVHDH